MGERVLLSISQNLTWHKQQTLCLILTHQCLGEFKKLIFFSLFFLPFAYYFPTFSNCHQLCTGTTSHLKHKFHSMTCRTEQCLLNTWYPGFGYPFCLYNLMPTMSCAIAICKAPSMATRYMDLILLLTS